ncbi:MAG: ABC transporter ATP-binding protein/permease [Bifidobacteriaceae bacterium]|jgi:ATP-binding cassette subfamily B protein/ATP-binding cassette subfamily B multidrug efflux pump|nr:ABC transporter ATP-binding protein/permease [Bifidobacteriaceae bacterium]
MSHSTQVKARGFWFKNSVGYLTFKQYWNELARDKWSLSISIITAASGFLVGNFISYIFVSSIINQIALDLSTRSSPNWTNYQFDIMMYIVSVAVSNLIIWRINAFIVWRQIARIANNLYYNCYKTVLYGNMAFFKRHTTEEIVDYIKNYVSGIITLDKILRGDIVPIVSSVLFTSVILGPIMPQYTLVLILSTLLFLLVLILTSKKIRIQAQITNTEQTDRSEMMFDVLDNITTVKARNAVENELNKLQSTNQFLDSQLPKFYRSYFPRDFGFASVITLASAALIFFIAGSQDWFGTDIGAIVLASSYTAIIMQQLWNMTFLLRDLFNAFAQSLEMTRIIEASKTHKKSTTKTDLILTNGEIRFENISFQFKDFRYQLSQTKMFNRFNLIIPGSQSVAIVGHSGAGKSTLVKFMMRFIEDYRGRILIDGQDISQVWQYTLHQQIGYISQNARLFNISIRDNITYGLENISHKQVVQACKAAQVWEVIKRMPNGLDTIVGQDGVELSGGQIQCINIAREILSSRKLIILDEPFSEVDPALEHRLNQAIFNLIEGKTAIVVGNHLKFAAQLDRIIVMRRGKIIEDGDHQTLMKKQGFYRELYDQ